MSTVKLSDRQQFALLALCEAAEIELADSRGTGGPWLAELMTRAGRETSAAGAHQAANGLTLKGLATKSLGTATGYVRYKLTDTGRRLAAQIRDAR